MKTRKQKIKIFFVIMLMINFSQIIFAQGIPCPYLITNISNCNVVAFEYIDLSTCQAQCISPQSLICPANTTTFLTPTGTCSCTFADEITMNIIKVGSSTVSTPLISVYGGCSGIIPTSDSGSYSSSPTCSVSYTFASSPTGATIQ
ncbi:MAG: hypothetical protein EBT39_03755 [Sphingobacteriia bacterium]|nr:hypothetical protein [Candidatus Fonsibacter lacus]